MKCLCHCLIAVVLLASFPNCTGLPFQKKFVTKKDLAYVSGGHEQQKLDLYLPLEPTKGPLLLWIHGGGWREGSKDGEPSKPIVTELTRLGYSIASLDYRYSTCAPFPAQIQDCKAAVRWLRAHAAEYGYDPKRIGAWGESAGGHLTVLLAATGHTRKFDVGENLNQSSAVSCGLDLYGPTDFPNWKAPSCDPRVQRGGKESYLTDLLGGEMECRPELARLASPITWVSSKTAPLYILHGTKDPIVGLEQSQWLKRKMIKVGAEVTLVEVKGAGHGGKEFETEDRKKKVLEFLNRHLGMP